MQKAHHTFASFNESNYAPVTQYSLFITVRTTNKLHNTHGHYSSSHADHLEEVVVLGDVALNLLVKFIFLLIRGGDLFHAAQLSVLAAQARGERLKLLVNGLAGPG